MTSKRVLRTLFEHSEQLLFRPKSHWSILECSNWEPTSRSCHNLSFFDLMFVIVKFIIALCHNSLLLLKLNLKSFDRNRQSFPFSNVRNYFCNKFVIIFVTTSLITKVMRAKECRILQKMNYG